jgi:hypothetical protein
MPTARVSSICSFLEGSLFAGMFFKSMFCKSNFSKQRSRRFFLRKSKHPVCRFL